MAGLTAAGTPGTITTTILGGGKRDTGLVEGDRALLLPAAHRVLEGLETLVSVLFLKGKKVAVSKLVSWCVSMLVHCPSRWTFAAAFC